MKTQNRSLLLLLIVLTVVIATIGTASAYCSSGQIFPCGTYVNMKVTTDKLIYNQGSSVTFTIKNAGTTSVWINPSPVTIKDTRSGIVVYDPNVDTCTAEVCAMVAVVPAQAEIKPGGTYKWSWDQKMNTGYACAYNEWECTPPSVGSGRYQGAVQIYGSDGTAYNYLYKSNNFRIR